MYHGQNMLAPVLTVKQNNSVSLSKYWMPHYTWDPVIANNSTNNNVVFFFVSDFKL